MVVEIYSFFLLTILYFEVLHLDLWPSVSYFCVRSKVSLLFLFAFTCWRRMLSLLAIRGSSLQWYLFRAHAHFLTGVLFFILYSFNGSLYILDTNPLSDVVCKYFLAVHGLSFHSLKVSFREHTFFYFY